MQSRRTTRASRLVVAQDAPSSRPTIARGAGSKLRPGAGLTKVAHDPNTAKPHGTSSKDPANKEAGTASDSAGAGASAAPVKRKREALGEVAAKNGKTKAPPVVADKENHYRSTKAYVEVPAPPPRTRPTARAVPPPERKVSASTTTTRAKSSRTTTSTSAAPAIDEETRDEEAQQLEAHTEDDAMLIDEPEAPIRSSRRLSSRIAAPTNPSGATSRRSVTTKRSTVSSTRTTRRAVKATEDVDEGGAGHVAKKRRTSSVGPDEKDEVLHEHNVVLTNDDYVEAEEHALVEEVKWDDLDKEDEGDPLMVSEYVVEIFHYLQQLETGSMPNPQYMDNQKDLAWKMRGILMDWLIQVHSRFRLLPETLFLAVNIVDRFLSARSVSLVRLQLVGVTAMFIASKYEEIMAPSVNNFIYCSDSTYTEKDILDAEKYILRSIDWNLSYPNPINFLRRSSKADGYDLQVRTIAKYLIEIACVDWRLLPHPPSMIAAAGMWLARLILDKEEWTPNLEHYSGYDEATLLPAAQLMLTYILRSVKHESFYKKYAAKKYLKVSTYVRDWAWAKFGIQEVEYDDEGESLTGVEPHKHIVPVPTSILLVHELPRLREESRRRREEDAALDAVAEEEET